ncbi:MAG TPA: type II toxin-antitoxin system HicB family antitoxin [Xanthobacteraceae bacterium]
MKEDVTRIPDYRIEVRVLPRGEGPGYMAWVPDLPGCECRGETVDGAIMGVQQAIAEWIAAALDRGEPIPDPSE